MNAVIGWFIGAYLMPPIMWLVTSWFFGIWNTDEMVAIIVSPVIWIYVGVFVVTLFVVVRRRLHVVARFIAGERDETTTAAAQREVSRLPRFFLVTMAVYTMLGTVVVLAGQRFIDRVEFILAFLVGVPIIFLFAILFFVKMVARLDAFAREVPISSEFPSITINFKLVSIFLFNVLGLTLVFVTAALATVYKAPPEALFSLMMQRLVVTSIAGMIFTAVNLLLLSKQITGPVATTSRGVQLLADGDLSSTLAIASRDEIGRLGRDFNRSLEILRRMIGRIKGQADAGMSVGTELRHSAETASEAIETIRTTVADIRKQIETLSSEVYASGTGIDEVRTFVDQVQELINDQNLTIEASTRTISSMVESIRGVAEQVEANRDKTRQLESATRRGETEMNEHREAIASVGESADAIMNMLTVINKIAAQTNLLAMNAAIEAAHAGDYGRGFSVVAQEIRSLAENAAENAKKIGTSLRDVIEKIKLSQESVRRTEDIFSEITTQIASTAEGIGSVHTAINDLRENSSAIGQTLTALVDQSQQVRDASKGVGEQIGTVATSITTVHSLSQTVNTGTEGINRQVDDLSRTVEAVADAGRRSVETVNTLEELVDQFHLNEGE